MKVEAAAVLLSLVSVPQLSVALDNGLARTPPMGWMSWQRYRCETNCDANPDACINEDLYKAMADRLANDGWADVGYNQVNVDDCWPALERDPTTHEQVPDPDRFPNGIDGLADYVHSLGLKFGLYSDIGTKTCGGYPGMEGYFELDSNLFASWNIDMLKVDGCYADVDKMYETYPDLGKYLAATGRDIIYSCSWPAYLNGNGENGDYNTTMADLAKNCNLWRNFDDITDSWDSVKTIVNFWERDYHSYQTMPFLNVVVPGAWNDPDMIIGGNYGLSFSQQQTQFALWAIVAAPLLMSNDLRDITDDVKALLQNEEIIAINQDALGKQGGYIWRSSVKNPQIVIWMRELEDTDSLAIVFQNNDDGGDGTLVGFNPYLVPSFVDNGSWNADLKLSVRDILNKKDLGSFSGYFNDYIHPSSVGMYKVTRV